MKVINNQDAKSEVKFRHAVRSSHLKLRAYFKIADAHWIVAVFFFSWIQTGLKNIFLNKYVDLIKL